MQIKLLIISLAFCPLLFSQSASTESSKTEPVTKVIHVHGDAVALAELSGHGSGAFVLGNNQLRAVVIRGKASDVANVEQTVRDLDTTSGAAVGVKNVELIIYLVSGSMQPIAGSSDAGAELLASVYKQLRAVFPYKNYQLLSTMLMRSGQNSFSITSGMLKALQNNPDLNIPGSYTIRYDAVTVSGDSSPSIHLANFKFEAKVPYVSGSLGAKSKDGSIPYANTQYQQASLAIETNVDLREGQKVVVGTSNVETADATLFLVVTARLIQ